MSLPTKFSIDLNEKFPTLKFAPSIEAVIHWQAYASNRLDPETLSTELKRRLPNYPVCQAQYEHGIQINATTAPEGKPDFSQHTQWNGFRLQDEQARHIAQFTPTGVIFSRLEPYEKWETFIGEALRFWDIFLELAEPKVIDRLGVRHINRIPLNDGEPPSLYLKTLPSTPSELLLSTKSFFYQDTYQVPNYSYEINWVRTLQPKGADPSGGQALIVDIDTFTTDLLQLDHKTLTRRLSEMRWLKNKVFFSCITRTALKRFGATRHDR